MTDKNNENSLVHVSDAPFRAYKGDDPYIFVSYAHIDANRVFPELKRFHNQGFNVWYDQGISPGGEWPEEIEEALEKSSLFVVFISASAVESRNVRNEINFALHENKPFIAIHLEETELKYGLKLSMGSIQGILKYSMDEEEYVHRYTSAFSREGFKASGTSHSDSIEDYGGNFVHKTPSAYVFACYSRDDEELVRPELERFASHGLDIKTSSPENERSEENVELISDCSLFIVFITSNSANDLNVIDEIYFALSENLPVVVICLQEVRLRHGLRLKLASRESIKKYLMEEDEYVQKYTSSFERHGFELIKEESLIPTDEKYVFTSFDSKDSDEIRPYLKQFTDFGLNVMCNAGEFESEEYDEKITGSSLFLLFLTPNSVKSNLIRDEMFIALDEDVPIVVIYLSEVEMSRALKRQLSSASVIRKHELDEVEFKSQCIEKFKDAGFEPVRPAEKLQSEKKNQDSRLSSDHLRQFDKLNTTTDSIFDLKDNKVLIILKDGKNLTDWNHVVDKRKVIYVSENLSGQKDLSFKYNNLRSLRAVVTTGVSSVTSMESMFEGCTSLTDFVCTDEWDVGKVENMASMFKRCQKLADLSALTNWDVSNVKNMNTMFEACISLKELSALAEWDVSNVRNMSGMFSDCRLERMIALKNWDVSGVTNMEEMFRGCSALLDLFDLKDWNVGNVENMHSMFEGCFALDNLFALKDWNVSNVKNMDSLFRGCEHLVDLFAFKDWDVSNVTTMESMFRGCRDIVDLFALKHWDVSNVRNMRGMFSTCSGLEYLTALRNWDVSNVQTMRSMFYGCYALSELSALAEWDVSNVENMWTMFSFCGSLSDLSAIKDWNVGNVQTMWAMFSDCRALKDLSVLDSWDITDMTNISSIFEGCNNVEKYPKWYRE
ncbi:BspA family leucine-rich repeat surface protein [Methanobrevibacter sp.]|uniref:BspA family leucine-rich repeat surface protein n=1 Tax=Methanobrevibacter sp. TaxID=66852 RepID=UPI003890FE42